MMQFNNMNCIISLLIIRHVNNTMKKIVKKHHRLTKSTCVSCNLSCSHCMYLNKAQTYSEYTTCDMDDTALLLFIHQKIEAQKTNDVIFSWQSDELTSDRFHFFKRVIELQQQCAQGKKIINTLLTNGILLDDGWCEFFKTNQFLISLSVDGDAAPYDNIHETISGKLTNDLVKETVKLLQQHDIEFNTLTIVNAINSQQPLRIYRYLKSLGSRHMQFIPLLEPLAPGSVDKRSLAPAELAKFLKTIFYTWIRLDIGVINIPIFEHTFAAWCGLSTKACAFAPIVEQHKEALAAECTDCKVKFICRGGCPKERVALSRRGVPELNYFCESYLAFFTYVEPYMLMMRGLWEQNYPPSNIRQYLA